MDNTIMDTIAMTMPSLSVKPTHVVAGASLHSINGYEMVKLSYRRLYSTILQEQFVEASAISVLKAGVTFTRNDTEIFVVNDSHKVTFTYKIVFTQLSWKSFDSHTTAYGVTPEGHMSIPADPDSLKGLSEGIPFTVSEDLCTLSRAYKVLPVKHNEPKAMICKNNSGD